MEGAIARRLHNDNEQVSPFPYKMRNQPTHCGRTRGNADGLDTRTGERDEQPVDPYFPCRHSAAFHTPSQSSKSSASGITSSSPAAMSATCASKRSRCTTGSTGRRLAGGRLNGSDVEIPLLGQTAALCCCEVSSGVHREVRHEARTYRSGTTLARTTLDQLSD